MVSSNLDYQIFGNSPFSFHSDFAFIRKHSTGACGNTAMGCSNGRDGVQCVSQHHQPTDNGCEHESGGYIL